MATAGAANATAWALLAIACDASHFHALAVLLLLDASQMFSLWLVRGCTVRSICHIKLSTFAPWCDSACVPRRVTVQARTFGITTCLVALGSWVLVLGIWCLDFVIWFRALLFGLVLVLEFVIWFVVL